MMLPTPLAYTILQIYADMYAVTQLHGGNVRGH